MVVDIHTHSFNIWINWYLRIVFELLFNYAATSA